MWSTDRLSIDSLRAADARELFEALDHPEIAEALGGPDVESLPWLEERIARILNGPPPDAHAAGWLNFVVRLGLSGGVVIGRLEATLYDGWAEVAWVLSPAQWGRGYGAEAGSWLVRHLEDAYATTDLWATVHPLNVRSIGLLEHLGFREQSLPARRLPETYEAGDLVFARS